MSLPRAIGVLVWTFILAVQIPAALAIDRIRIATGPETGLQPQMAREFGRYVAKPAGLDVEPLTGTGPAESLQRLLDGPGVKLALVQSDAATAYGIAAEQGNPEAIRLVAPVRVIAPLYLEPIYFIARSDSAADAIHDIRNLRINIGPAKSASALSASVLYRLLFGSPLPEDRTSMLEPEEALAKLITDHTIDVVVLVAEQPARLLANMKPEARRFIKLLRFDADQPSSAAALRIYEATRVHAASYPNLLSADLPALAVRLYLVGYGSRRDDEEARLVRLARNWCQNLPRLQAEGHALWREVELAAPDIRPGWTYAHAARREIAQCAGMAAAPATGCSLHERVLGLCQ